MKSIGEECETYDTFTTRPRQSSFESVIGMSLWNYRHDGYLKGSDKEFEAYDAQVY